LPPHPLPLPAEERGRVRGNFKYFWLGSDEKDLPTPWDFWNLSSDFFRNSSF
jgi:hypothetical protein